MGGRSRWSVMSEATNWECVLVAPDGARINEGRPVTVRARLEEPRDFLPTLERLAQEQASRIFDCKPEMFVLEVRDPGAPQSTPRMTVHFRGGGHGWST